MKINIFHLPDEKLKMNLKSLINKGTAVGFTGGLVTGCFLSSLVPVQNSRSKQSVQPNFVVHERHIKDLEIEDNDVYETQFSTELDGEDNYSDLSASGNSIYGNYQGVDLSNLNGDVDLSTIQNNGVDFVILRAFDSYFMDYEKDYLSELDHSFLENARDCEKYGIPFGIYVYSRATTEKMAEQEAVKLMKFLSKYHIRPDFPIYWDIERSETQPLKDESNNSVNSREFIQNHPEQVLNNFKAFANVLEKYHYYAGIYTSDSVLCEIDPTGEELADYAVWDAAYKYGEGGKRMDFETEFDGMVGLDYPGDVGIYQFSCTGEMAGVPNTVDCNVAKYNYANAIHQLELNVPLDYDTYFGDSTVTYKDIVDGESPKTNQKKMN